MAETELHENDVAKLQGKVLRLNDERTAAYLDVIGKRYWVEVDDLELVERPGPHLEDLPDGAVVRRSDVENCGVFTLSQFRKLLINPLNGVTMPFTDWEWPFEVIGACPGTPAWELWARTYTITEKATIDQDHNVEWWRSE